jgi:hypothetical protein
MPSRQNLPNWNAGGGHAALVSRRTKNGDKNVPIVVCGGGRTHDLHGASKSVVDETIRALSSRSISEFAPLDLAEFEGS